MVVELERYESVVQEGAAETTPARAVAVIDLRQDTTTPPTIITPWDIQASYPDWSPTEDRIVFATYDLGKVNETDEASNLYTEGRVADRGTPRHLVGRASRSGSDPEIQAEKDDEEPDRASREHLESWRMGEIAGPGHRWQLRLTAHSGMSAG
jgi:hypothetical protein